MAMTPSAKRSKGNVDPTRICRFGYEEMKRIMQKQDELNEKQRQQQTPINIDAILKSSKARVSVDLDLFDCPVCFQFLRPPIFHCSSGHFLCKSCCNRIPNKKCPSCSLPIGSNRCITFEKLVEASVLSCVYKQYGCVEELSYLNKLEHENTCKYTPIACPERGCEFIGASNCLYTHFAENHPSSPHPFTFNTCRKVTMIVDEVHRLFQETEEKILFVFHRVVDPLGSFLNVTCVAPPTASDMSFSFELTAVQKQQSIISLKSTVELTPECFAEPDKEKCLLIRNNFHHIWNAYKELTVELIIRRGNCF